MGSKNGFTLLEIIIAIGILTLLAVIAFNVFSGLRRAAALNAAVEEGVSLLAEARSRTLASQGALSHGVHFEIGQMVLFRGPAYSPLEPSNEAVDLPLGVEISAIAVGGGGAEVIFQRLTGETANFGTVTFRLISDPAKTKVITIQQSGNINL